MAKRYRFCQAVHVEERTWVLSNVCCQTKERALGMLGQGTEKLGTLPNGAIAGARIGDSVLRLVYEEDAGKPVPPVRQDIRTSA